MSVGIVPKFNANMEVAGLLFVDMYSRLLARFKTTDVVKKTQ